MTLRPSAFHIVGLLIALSLWLGLSALRIWDPGILELMRNRMFDQMQVISPRDDLVDSPVRVVDIDDASLEELGQWPWPRRDLAQLVDRIFAQGAAAVGFDILLIEADRTSPVRLREMYPELAAWDQAGTLPDHDYLLAQSITDRPVSLGVGHRATTNGTGEGPERDHEGHGKHPGMALLGGDPWAFLPRAGQLLTPLPLLSENSGIVGNTIPAPEQDGIARRIPTVIADGDRLLPWLAISTVMEAIDVNTIVLRSGPAGVRSVSLGGIEVPTDAMGRVWLRYRPFDESLYISASDVMADRLDGEPFRNKVVFLGSSATALGDLHDFPFGRTLPGVEAHVQFTEMMLTNKFLNRPTDADMIEMIVAGVAVIIVAVATLTLPARLGVGVLIFVIGTLSYGSWRAFDLHALLLDATFPAGAAFLAYVVLALLTLLRAERQRLFMKAAFAHYLPPQLVADLVRNPEMLRLGGENRELTILFCDIRGFTAMAEVLQDRPDQLSIILNELFGELSQVVMEHGGTIDKYLGDAMMAFWNAPIEVKDHRAKAVEAALEINRRITPINSRIAKFLATESIGHVPFIQIGIGIATGVSLVGNMGSHHRFNYTALGDAVNLASRLETLTQKYQVPILISQETARTLQDRFVLLEIDQVRVKGREDVTEIFLPLGDRTLLSKEGVSEYVESHAEMLAAMRSGDGEGATDAAMDCLTYDEASSELYAYYLDRISAG